MNFSRPIQTEMAELPCDVSGAQPRPVLRRSSAMYFDRESVIDPPTGVSMDRSPASKTSTASPHPPFDRPALSQALLDNVSAAQANRTRGQRFYSNLPSPQEEPEIEKEPYSVKLQTPEASPDMTPCVDDVLPELGPKKGCYYSHALPVEDRRGPPVGGVPPAKPKNGLYYSQAPLEVKPSKASWYSPVLREEDKGDPLVSEVPPAKPRKGRYYSEALSEEDKRALAMGEENHNLRKWTHKDLVRYHGSRLELVPTVIENREEVINRILQEKQQSEQKLLKMEKANRQAFSRSMVDLRRISAPLPTLSPLSSVLVEQAAPLSPYESGTHTGRASAGDYFSGHHARHLSLQSQRSSLSSPPPLFVRSPLSAEVRPYEYSPSVTFDSFLAPHTSGKGEAYRGAENAKRMEGSGEVGSDSIESHEARKKRLSKKPSLPIMRKRKSKGGNSPLGASPLGASPKSS